jgi:hypothetical protein
MIKNENCITVKQLKEFIKDWPEQNEQGEDNEVWIETSDGLSNTCKSVWKLNGGDLIFNLECY